MYIKCTCDTNKQLFYNYIAAQANNDGSQDRVVFSK